MYKSRVSKAYYSITHWHDFRLKLFGEGILVGALAGLVIVLFRYLLERGDVWRAALFSYLQAASWFFTALWFAGLVGIAYILTWIVRQEPMSAGSGIPQVKAIILGIMRMNWLKVLIYKFIGGVLAIGAGLSLGREGPSIQLGATIGQGLSRNLGRTRMEERYLLTSGASAGLAAAFNAPLAGVIFSLEEMHKNFSPAVLMSAVAAAVTADVATQHFFGRNPIFNFTGIPILPVRYFGFVVLLGIIVGILGIAFNLTLLKTLDIYERQRLLPGAAKIALPLVVAGICGFVLPDILGGGNYLVNDLAVKSFTLPMLCLLLVGKFFFTMLSYGSGVPGGIFLPMLVIGALAGSVFSHTIGHLWQLNTLYSTNMIILAMAAYFAAVVKAPITGSVLIMEMTGSFSHMLSLIVVSMTAYLVADVFKTKPIYEALLDRSLEKQGKIPASVTEQKRTIVELAICLGSKLDGRQIKNIDWPVHCLLVSIKRGDIELVPKGDTKIMAGDYLYVLTNVDQAHQIRELAEECVL